MLVPMLLLAAGLIYGLVVIYNLWGLAEKLSPTYYHFSSIWSRATILAVRATVTTVAAAAVILFVPVATGVASTGIVHLVISILGKVVLLLCIMTAGIIVFDAWRRLKTRNRL
jgi:hypothetical protein